MDYKHFMMSLSRDQRNTIKQDTNFFLPIRLAEI